MALLVTLATRLTAPVPVAVRLTLLVAGISALVAGVVGVLGVRVVEFNWFTDDQWFDPKLLTDPRADGDAIDQKPAESLRRSFLKQTHAVIVDHNRRNETKAKWVNAGQWLLVVSGAGLGCRPVFSAPAVITPSF